MIDDEVRKIVEPELLPGEKLLWAEKVDVFKKNSWISKRQKKQKYDLLIFWLFGIFLIWIIIYVVDKRDGSISLLLAVLSQAPLWFFAGLVFCGAFVSFKNIKNPDRIREFRPYTAYALTANKLYYLDRNGICSELEAKNLKSVGLLKRWYFPNRWQTLCLVLSPVGKGIWPYSEIYFLDNYEKTKSHLEQLIRHRPNL